MRFETLLNRLHNAGLLEASGGPTAASNAIQEHATTLPPTKLLPNGDLPEETRRVSLPMTEGASTDGDVTNTYSQLVTSGGRLAFNARAVAQGIDLSERIHSQF